MSENDYVSRPGITSVLSQSILLANQNGKMNCLAFVGCYVKETDDQRAFLCFLDLRHSSETCDGIHLPTLLDIVNFFTLCGYYKDSKSLAQKKLRHNAITCGRKHL